MTLVLDTSGLYAALNPRERDHAAAAEALAAATPPLLLSPFVLAELDYLLLTRAGLDRELTFLGEVGRGAYLLAPFSTSDVAQARDLALQYRDLALGLADASVLLLCERHDTTDVLTLDHRHFRALRVHGRVLRLLPVDG